ncbi:MAG: rod shape-determining protein MreC [Cyclobacteriaceae bacterium]
MQRLFLFFYQYRAFFTFLILEFICAWLLVGNNPYQGARFFNSSNGLVAGLNNVSQGVREYFLLRQINSTLAEENAFLRSKFEELNQIQYVTSKHIIADSAVVKQFDFVSAKVVSNTVNRFTNFMTINKGKDDGIASGMAVISSLGAIGKVRTVSQNYSVVTSILHIDVQVSALLKRSGHFGTIQWDGNNPEIVKLKYIPRHVEVSKGDSVLTSGYNAIFPEGVMVGLVEEVILSDELFYDLKVKLSQDFRKLSYVEVVRNSMKHELDSLEQPFQEEVNK